MGALANQYNPEKAWQGRLGTGSHSQNDLIGIAEEYCSPRKKIGSIFTQSDFLKELQVQSTWQGELFL